MASPLSFSRTRRYFGSVPLSPELEVREPPDLDVLADLGGESRDQILDRLRLVTDVRLREQDVEVIGLHGRDLHRDLFGEHAELRIARDEVRLAVQLHQGAATAVGVDVRLDHSLGRLALGLLLGALEALPHQDLLRLLVVALRLLERSLAVHHAGARLLAQALHVLGIDRHDHSSAFFVVVLRVVARRGGAFGAAAGFSGSGAGATAVSTATLAAAGTGSGGAAGGGAEGGVAAGAAATGGAATRSRAGAPGAAGGAPR